MYLAAGRAEAAVASILAGGQPVVLAAAGWAIFGERASVRTILGLFVAMAGVVLVATASSGATSPAGVALSLLATAAPAAGTVIMRRLGSGIDLVVTTSDQFLLGGLMLFGVSALFESWAVSRRNGSPNLPCRGATAVTAFQQIRRSVPPSGGIRARPLTCADAAQRGGHRC